jgi:hypothetical protein
MSAIGIDSGSIRAPAMRCAASGASEKCLPLTEEVGYLPSAAILTDSGAPSLEWTSPLSPHGVGGEWPPEAMVGEAIGARRIPLALALASLEVPFESDESARKAKVEDQARSRWKWPSFSRALDRELKTESSSVLIRRSLQQLGAKEGAPVALAIPNALPLLAQTSLLGPASGRVRLIWRCMAAGLGYTSSFRGKPPAEWPAPMPGQGVLHVHLGLDGFEATIFSFREHQEKAGPSLIVPARRRAAMANTVSQPSLGLELLMNALRGRGVTTAEAMWETAFGSPLGPVLDAPSARQSGGAVVLGAGGRKAGAEDWPMWHPLRDGVRTLGNELQSRADDWVNEVNRLIELASESRPSLAILTGEFWGTRWGNESLSRVTAEMRLALVKLTQRHGLRLVHAPDLVARGAAIFGSRRERGWATYLDELPTVEILVNRGGEPEWNTVLSSGYCDAGVQTTISREGYRLAAGELHIELPVYVDEFGPDTADVLRCKVDFERATTSETGATLQVEVRSASGLPVVRAIVHGDVSQVAEVDWERDQAIAHTGSRKQEYIDALPRAFPPLERREAGAWWVDGGRYRVYREGSRTFTGEQLGRGLVGYQRHDPEVLLAIVRALYGLARKREFNPETGVWIGSTDLAGHNPYSAGISDVADRLWSLVGQKSRGTPAKISETAGRALAWLFCRDRDWVEHVLSHTAEIEKIKETHYSIVAMGHCIHREREVSRAIGALARRLRFRIVQAQITATEPKGIATFRALGTMFALQPDCLRTIDERVANQLASDVSTFIHMLLHGGGRFMQKFQAALRTLVFLTRRRAYQSGFLSPGSEAFNRAVGCVALVYVHARLDAECPSVVGAARIRRIDELKDDLKLLKIPGAGSAGEALSDTCKVIDDVDAAGWRPDNAKFPVNPRKLLQLLIQVTQYIEGRGTGILLPPPDDDEEDNELEAG